MGFQSMMLTVESFGADVVWTGLVQVFVLVTALLLGNVIRRKVPFMRKSKNEKGRNLLQAPRTSELPPFAHEECLVFTNHSS